MSWSTIRKATDYDQIRLDTAARRFAKRHQIPLVETENPTVEIHFAVEADSSLRPLWRRIVRYALGCRADGIAYGYVGNHVP